MLDSLNPTLDQSSNCQRPFWLTQRRTKIVKTLRPVSVPGWKSHVKESTDWSESASKGNGKTTEDQGNDYEPNLKF